MELEVRIFVVQFGQDDPRKCSSEKLCRMGLATRLYSIGKIPNKSLVLNPYSRTFSPEDKVYLANGLVIIDCSWKSTDKVFGQRMKGVGRKLPTLLAANPINYGKKFMLSSLEAVSAALYISGYVEHAKKLLTILKWGQTFLTLNSNLLEDYRLAETPEQIRQIELDYFP